MRRFSVQDWTRANCWIGTPLPWGVVETFEDRLTCDVLARFRTEAEAVDYVAILKGREPVEPPVEPSIYQRPAGTDQCMASCEYSEKHTDGKTHKHGMFCFREKGHKGAHRHWVPMDWVMDESVVRVIRYVKERRKR